MTHKFRAWDKKNETMSHKVRVSTYIDETMVEIANQLHWVERSFSDMILMQYTGLKDKNGVEIYEGDVVDYFKLSYSTIEWKNGGFIIKRLIDGEYETMQNRIAEIEVVGNVYENPELLEVEK